MTSGTMQRRADAVAAAREIADAAEREGCALTPDESSRVDALWREVDSLTPISVTPDADDEWTARA